MRTVGVLGAGTMGGGIAQVAAQAGWTARLMDVDAAFVQSKIKAISAQLGRLVEKGKLQAAAADEVRARIVPASRPGDFADCELVIEAVIEDMDLKARALAPLVAAARADAIFASNTSSLSISRLADAAAGAARASGISAAAAAGLAARFVGMHFFNPVPLMPLVEVIAGERSGAAEVQRVLEIGREWGKTAVRAKDTPGFIVNRVARGYYLESLRMLDEGVGGVSEIDLTLKRLGGFRMGPFELMDLIGIDVNYSVSCSVWEQMGRPARLLPHAIQQRLVQDGHVGRKARRGFYSYEGEPPVPAVSIERRTFECSGKLYDAVRRFCDAATTEAGSTTEQYVLARVLAAIMNEAALALDDETASPADIDTAMKLGTNYPHGPLEWAERVGRRTTAALLRELDRQTSDGRFAPAEWLQL